MIVNFSDLIMVLWLCYLEEPLTFTGKDRYIYRLSDKISVPLPPNNLDCSEVGERLQAGHALITAEAGPYVYGGSLYYFHDFYMFENFNCNK